MVESLGMGIGVTFVFGGYESNECCKQRLIQWYERGEWAIRTLIKGVNTLHDSSTFHLVLWPFLVVGAIDIEFCYEQ